MNIASLRVGDEVLVGPGEFSTVFLWTHFDPDFAGRAFVRLDTASGKSITLTSTHHIYVQGQEASLPASKVRLGHLLLGATGEPDLVISKSVIDAQGLFNPQTLHGNLVVDGFIASVPTKLQSPA